MAENRNNQNLGQEDSRNQNPELGSERTEQGVEGTEQRTGSPLGGQHREQQDSFGRGESGRETGLDEQSNRSSNVRSDRSEDASI